MGLWSSLRAVLVLFLVASGTLAFENRLGPATPRNISIGDKLADVQAGEQQRAAPSLPSLKPHCSLQQRVTPRRETSTPKGQAARNSSTDRSILSEVPYLRMHRLRSENVAASNLMLEVVPRIIISEPEEKIGL